MTTPPASILSPREILEEWDKGCSSAASGHAIECRQCTIEMMRALYGRLRWETYDCARNPRRNPGDAIVFRAASENLAVLLDRFEVEYDPPVARRLLGSIIKLP